MIYHLIGTTNIINKAIEKIRNESGISFNSVIKYDGEEASVNDILYELESVSLFDDKKMVIVNNIDKLSDDKKLSSYIEDKKDKNVLVLVSSKALDARKKLSTLLKEKAKVIDYNEFDIEKYVKDSLKGYKISPRSIYLLLEYTNREFEKLENEINKLKMLKLEEKEITEEDITENCLKSLNINIFNLIDALNKGNKSYSFDIVNELIYSKEDEIKILITLANNYRLIYRTKVLMGSCDDKKLMELLDVKSPYRLKKLKEQSHYYDENKLLEILKFLSDLDLKIKTGKLDKGVALELFITKV